MKKLSNKKGLFLAEILLAVVIAAVIMGSGYLLYADIQSENNKNTATANLQALIAKMTVIYGEENITGATLPAHETATLVKSRDIPSTFDQDYSAGTLNSVYGTAMTIGPVAADTKNWYVSYSALSIEQCAKLLPGINKTKPIAITEVVAAQVVTDGSCASAVTSKRKAMAAGLCDTDAATLTVYYSPAKQDFDSCIAQ